MELDYTRHPGFAGHKAVHIFYDKDTGLLAIVAIHNDDLGTALGGTRMLPYTDFGAALTDVLRLSKGMTNKAAMAGLNQGGGKCVLIGDPKTMKTPELLRALGRKLNSLDGKFITGEDVNISVADIERVAEETPFVAGRSEAVPGGSGDPSIMTALGVLHGIRAALKHRYGDDSFKDRTVAIMGVGKVGFRLARLLHQRQARLVFSDSDPHMVERALTEFSGARQVSVEEIYDQECDVFAPCALGSILNGETIPRLRCAVVAGAANNQLATPEDGHLLHARGISYAVDYVIN
ncbi:MAG: Glu/Leu/Phe/Val dehydrogenase, partial [Candidatus Sungbacteria bacterium]|nr:Glu/Leu/Phe/Val dehydrogenase [Candidatus Sungbacteria bacterium]